MEEGRFSFFKSSRFRPVSLTLLRAQTLALRRNCWIKFTWGHRRETIILSSLNSCFLSAMVDKTLDELFPQDQISGFFPFEPFACWDNRLWRSPTNPDHSNTVLALGQPRSYWPLGIHWSAWRREQSHGHETCTGTQNGRWPQLPNGAYQNCAERCWVEHEAWD